MKKIDVSTLYKPKVQLRKSGDISSKGQNFHFRENWEQGLVPEFPPPGGGEMKGIKGLSYPESPNTTQTPLIPLAGNEHRC